MRVWALKKAQISGRRKALKSKSHERLALKNEPEVLGEANR
jgi:hypothetical protein